MRNYIRRVYKPKKPSTRNTYKFYNLDFDSNFEKECAIKINSEILDRDEIIYHEQVKYFPDKDYTCDFVITKDGITYWIEVSKYKRSDQTRWYFSRIEKKREWVNLRGDSFIFVNSEEDLAKLITLLKK